MSQKCNWLSALLPPAALLFREGSVEPDLFLMVFLFFQEQFDLNSFFIKMNRDIFTVISKTNNCSNDGWIFFFFAFAVGLLKFT